MPHEVSPRRALVMLVGVASPARFRYEDKFYAFRTAHGVGGDLDFYEQFLRERLPPEDLQLIRLESPDDTTVTNVKSTLLAAASELPGRGLFVLVLCGHGFQAKDLDGDEPDGLDEVFAASDGPLLDDFFGQLWTKVPATADIVVIADTCSSDSVGIAGGPSVEPVVSLRAAGPSRLSISASMPWETAGEVTTRFGVRGILSRQLEDVWKAIPESHASYLAWFLPVAQDIAVSHPRQHPRLRYLAPDDRLLTTPPFQLRA